MNIVKMKLMALAVACTLGLVACNKPHTAENAGKEIDQASEKLSEQTAKTGVALDDSAITAKVKAAILGEPGLKSLDINVDTVSGTVTLAGKVDTQASSDKAKQIAGAVSDVKQVNNQLKIK